MKPPRIFLILLFIFALASCKPPAEPVDPPNNNIDVPVDDPGEEPVVDHPWPEDVIIVTSPLDSGPGTLRQALQEAQDGDTITFEPAVFPTYAPEKIYVIEQLPHIHVDSLTIDASNAGVILDGSDVSGEWEAGITIVESEDTTIIGLQISHFPGPGISINGNSNIIGGDRGIGEGPVGQGNLLTENVIGIEIDGKNNSIIGNLIGIDLSGSDWVGNEGYGVQLFEASQENTIGPDNIIANNGEYGIYIDPRAVEFNTITGNEIYDNAIGRGTPAYPALFDFDFAVGTVSGATCPDCTIEIYSANGYDGEILEGETAADAIGIFTFKKGESFTGPMLTARTTSPHERSSGFIWPPSSSTHQTLVVQTGNSLPRTQFFNSLPIDIADNHIATQYDGIDYEDDFSDLAIYRQGVTHARVSTNGIEPQTDNWENPEMPLSQAQQDHFTRMADEGITVTFVMVFWDKENFPGGEGLPCYRFQTEEEIESWLVYVRHIVEILHDRVQYFEIWNEPDIRDFCPKSVYLEDYINLVKRTAPVIHAIAPEAKVVVGGVSGTAYDNSYNYLLGVLRSDAMPLVDVIGWHPMYNFTPDIPRFRNYYYAYPDKIQEIKDIAGANGFEGEYHATELSFRPEIDLGDEFYTLSQIGANKYFLQSAIMHRGEGIDIGLGSGYFVIRRLSTAMAGVGPEEFPVEIEPNLDHLMSYTFSTMEDEKMVAVWRHTEVSEFDPGVESTITITNTTASKVVAIDLLYNMEQELNFEMVNGNLVIEDLLIKDYPILIRLED